jgi:hypothetical protein
LADHLNLILLIKLMKSLIVQFADRHAECIGIVIEYMLKESLECIDVFLGARDSNTAEWFKFFKDNYEGIVPINRIELFPQSSYQYHRVIFLTSTDYNMIDKLNPIIRLIDYRNMGALVHQYTAGVFRDNFINLAISPLIPLIQINMSFRFFRDKHTYDNSFIPSVIFFMTGWGEHINLKNLNDEFVKNDIHCLFISKRESDTVFDGRYSNILFCKNIKTSDLIRCFLYKICIFFPNSNSIYLDERISGSIHLSASFANKLYLPNKIKELFPDRGIL